jgi:hypothetical protein
MKAWRTGRQCVSLGRILFHLERTIEERKAECRRFHVDFEDVRRDLGVVKTERNDTWTIVVSQIREIRDANEERSERFPNGTAQRFAAFLMHTKSVPAVRLTRSSYHHG